MGFFSKLAKATLKAAVSSLPPKKNNAGSKLESAAPAWKVCRYDSKTGFPKIFLSNNREWFDADRTWTSPSGKFFVHDGYFNGGDDSADSYIALTTRSEGLKRKAVKGSVEATYVSDEGVAYVLTDSGTLHRLTKDGTSSKQLMDEYCGFAINGKVCALIDDDGYNIKLIVVNLNTNATMKKQFSYEDDIELENGSLLEPTVVIDSDNIIITMPDGTKQVVNIA